MKLHELHYREYRRQGKTERGIDPSVTLIYPHMNFDYTDLEYLTDGDIENIFLRDKRDAQRTRIFHPLGIQFKNGHVDGIEPPTTISKVAKKYNFPNPDFVADLYEFLYRNRYIPGYQERKPMTENDFTNAREFLREDELRLNINLKKRLRLFQQHLKEVPLEKLVFRSNIIHSDALSNVLRELEIDYSVLTKDIIPALINNQDLIKRLFRRKFGKPRTFNGFLTQLKGYLGENFTILLDLDDVRDTLMEDYQRLT